VDTAGTLGTISQPLACAPRFRGSPLSRPGLRNLRLCAGARPLRQVAWPHRLSAVPAPRVSGIHQPASLGMVLVRGRPVPGPRPLVLRGPGRGARPRRNQERAPHQINPTGAGPVPARSPTVRPSVGFMLPDRDRHVVELIGALHAGGAPQEARLSEDTLPALDPLQHGFIGWKMGAPDVAVGIGDFEKAMLAVKPNPLRLRYPRVKDQRPRRLPFANGLPRGVEDDTRHECA
jgi:hypothetical protein